MARRRAAGTPTISSPAGSSGQAADRTLYTHNLWLNYLKPVSLGLVFSPSALRAAQIELPLHDPHAQHALEALTTTPEPTDLSDTDFAPRCLRSTQEFLTGFLGWQTQLLDWFEPSQHAHMFHGQNLADHEQPTGTPTRPAPPQSLCPELPHSQETLEPSFAYRWPEPAEQGAGPDGPASTWCLLGLEVPTEVDLDRKPAEYVDHIWNESPQKKFERLLYETRVPVGLIIQGSAVRVVYRPEEQQSGYITFPLDALLKPAGRLNCTALKELLNHDRIHRLPSRQRLHPILVESRKYQNEVSTELAEQVLAALFELLKGFEAADAEVRGALLHDLRTRPDRTPEIYEGLLTVLMRLVFLLYAEEREMFPADDLFVKNYSIAGLFARLVEDAARHPDTMDQRFGAWAHLVALFRMMHDGATYNDPSSPNTDPKKIPARQGDLFNPTRFPFLEGRQDAHSEPFLPRLPDGAILNVLRHLLYLRDERLSYRSLEVEQIGSVYEAVMGYRVETATGRSLAIRPEKRTGAPVTVDLDALLALAPTKRVERFKEQTDRKLPTATAAAVKNATSEQELATALDRLVDRRLTPAPVPAGSLVFQPSPERRKSGSHYTPRSLTGPIVAKALQPVLQRLGENPTPEAILGLRVCDPAMGSGAFLVEVMRQLARALEAAWKTHGKPPRIPKDETPNLFACRLIAQRCLYGVDKNPMAVNLAKMSLWLATLARDHDFAFLDHNLRHGDSLVGLSMAQIEACHWAPEAQQGFASQSLRRQLASAIQSREQIRAASDLTSYAKLTDLRLNADRELEFLRFLGNAVIGCFFEGGTTSAIERRRNDLAHTIRDYVNDKIDMPTRLVLRREIEQPAQRLQRLEPPVEPFHWEVEFPEVFLESDAKGNLKRRANGGFDAMVGNPPFMGGSSISSNFGQAYLSWLLAIHSNAHGNADLVAHFFRRSFALIRPGGTFGLIATNTIGQGDTRSTGLRFICQHGGTIYAARKRLKWPGEAAVVVSVIHIHNGSISSPYELDGRPVEKITAFLFPSGGHDDPARLHANAGVSFLGSKVYGNGFTFDDTDTKGKASPITRQRADELARSGDQPISMEELIAADPRNQERIFPYIGGKEVNDSPTHMHHRYVINFGQMTEDEARAWPDLMKIVEERVKPERMRLGGNASALDRKRHWWRWGRYTPALFNAIRGLDRVLVCSLHQPYWLTSFLQSQSVFSHALAVFAIHAPAGLCLLQSNLHELWARFLGSSMKDDLRYTPSDCFETFPFPLGWETSAALEAAGQTYYEYRAQLMVASNLGLTKTYNRFHDPKERAPEITRLRELHALMDQAVLEAYGWTDLDTVCGFDLDYCELEPVDGAAPETLERLETGRYFFELAEEARAFAAELNEGSSKLPWRYRWRPEVRDEVLARLLALNAERAETERMAGLSPLAPVATEANESDEDPDDA